MTETDLQLGGGYTYQWECAILLALNTFFEPVRYNPTLFDLIQDFLGEVAEIHLEGEDRENGIDLEDINLVSADGDRRILIQVKTKQAEGKLWTPGDSLLLKSLYRFYDSGFFAERPDEVRFIFLSNRGFNPALVRVKDAIREGTLDRCDEVDQLHQRLTGYANREKKGATVDLARFRELLARTALVEYLAVDTVKANVQAKLQGLGRQDWEQAHRALFEYFGRQSTRIGGGTVTRESVARVLGPPPEPTRRERVVQTIIYDGVKPVSAGDLLHACQAQVASMIQAEHPKYESQLYVNRAIERDLCAFFDIPSVGPGPNCFLIVAPAGSGKTNLLCDLARVRVSHQPVLLLMGGTTYLSGTTGLLGAVKEELETASPEVAFRSAADSLHTLHRLAEEMGHDALLFLDAINEHDRPAAMRQALEDLLRKTRGRRVKLVVTCRDYYWGLFKGSFWEGATVNELPDEDDVDEEDAGADEDDFSRFAADEHERALELYLAFYNVSGRPVGDAAEQCRHPLLLRFFCEAYEGQDVGQVEDIRLKELFDHYWKQKLISIVERMVRRDERRQHGLVEEVGEYLLNVAAYMLHNHVRAVPLDEMAQATQRTERYDDPNSVYGRICDEFIILEENERGRGRRKVRQVAFVYEEFMEYVMASSLMRDWDAAGLDEAAILTEIEALTGKYASFAQILGVMVYLALMLKEEWDLALWSLLLNKGERWQKVIFEAFRKLPEDQLDSGVFDTLEQMLRTDDEAIQVQVLDLLKLERVGTAASTSAAVVDLTCDLAGHSQVSIARRAVLALRYMPPDSVIPVLIEALDHPRAATRKNAAATLGQLRAERAVDPLIDALKDSTSRVQQSAARALAQMGDERAVGPLIAALKDDDGAVRWTAAGALIQLGDAAVDPLIAELKDVDWEVLWLVGQVLGELGDERAVEPFIAKLEDGPPAVRQVAVDVLGRLGDERAVEPLIAVLEDDDELVRKSAANALRRIGSPEALAAVRQYEARTTQRVDADCLGG